MSSIDISKYRNIGISAHIDAGKTTTTERILYLTGINHKIGEVHDGAATMDWMDQEQERGITITAACTTTFWAGSNTNKEVHHLNIIDTPGHIDFTIEVERSMRVLDGLCMVYCAVGGVQPQSESVWRQAKKHNVPSICFINKMDRAGADFHKVCQQLKSKLGAHPLVVVLPYIDCTAQFVGVIDLIKMCLIVWPNHSDGQTFEQTNIPPNCINVAQTSRNRLVEDVAELDDEIMKKYLDNVPIQPEELTATIRRLTIKNLAQPVLCGSAFKNKGIQPLLDAIIDYLPSPTDMPAVANKSDQALEQINVHYNKFVALAFKIVSDPFVGQLAFVRIYAGAVQVGDVILNSTKKSKERVSRILKIHANHRQDILQVHAGDIAALVGLKTVTTGDTLCDTNTFVLLEPIQCPEPVIAQAVRPESKEDQERLGAALNKLSKEDPSFKSWFDSDSHQTIISGMGELHLEIMVERLKREFKVKLCVGSPEVAFRETISKAVTNVEGKYIKQTGGRGQYGHVVISMCPNPGGGVVFQDNLKGGAIPKEYVPAINKGVSDALAVGVLKGFQVIDVKIVLVFGSFHEVDSNEHAFRMAGVAACKKALQEAGPIVLEPIMRVTVEIPSEHLGSIVSNILSRRGIMNSTNLAGTSSQIIEADVPLTTMFGYATKLRSLTQGRGTYVMEFKNYREVKKELINTIKSKHNN